MRSQWSNGARALVRVAQSTWLRRAVLTCALIALAAATVSRRSEIGDALRSLGSVGITTAGVAVTASIMFQWLAWHRCLAGLGSTAPMARTLPIFLLSLPGKYLPGGVWTTMLQVEHGARADIDRPRSLGASLLAMLSTLVVGALIGVGFLFDGTVDVPYWWLFPVAIVPGLALLLPPVQRRLTGRLRRLMGRGEGGVALSARATFAVVAWNVCGWAMLGVHIVVLTNGSVPIHRATAAFALSWTLGFLFLVAPAGAGIRDVALAATLGASLEDGTGVAVALLSRAVVTLVDLTLAGAAIAIAWRRARSERQDEGTVTSSE